MRGHSTVKTWLMKYNSNRQQELSVLFREQIEVLSYLGPSELEARLASDYLEDHGSVLLALWYTSCYL